MDHLLLTTAQTAGIVIATCLFADFIIIHLVRYGKIKRIQRKSVTSK